MLPILPFEDWKVEDKIGWANFPFNLRNKVIGGFL
jgi:hypothetical protein